MPNLIKSVFTPIKRMYEAYSKDNNRTDMLEQLIAVYESWDSEKVASYMSDCSVTSLCYCNKQLNCVAESYLVFASQAMNKAQFKEALIYVSKAQQCYQLIEQYLQNVPPHALTQALGFQEIAVTFALKKNLFYQAKIYFLEAQAAQMVIPEQKAKIVTMAYQFLNDLNREYKDRALQKALGINNKLLTEVTTLVEQAEALPSQQSDSLQTDRTFEQKSPVLEAQPREIRKRKEPGERSKKSKFDIESLLGQQAMVSKKSAAIQKRRSNGSLEVLADVASGSPRFFHSPAANTPAKPKRNEPELKFKGM